MPRLRHVGSLLAEVGRYAARNRAWWLVPIVVALLLLGLLILSSFGILTGVQLGKKIPTTHLQRGFGWFVLGTGILIIIRELSG